MFNVGDIVMINTDKPYSYLEMSKNKKVFDSRVGVMVIIDEESDEDNDYKVMVKDSGKFLYINEECLTRSVDTSDLTKDQVEEVVELISKMRKANKGIPTHIRKIFFQTYNYGKTWEFALRVSPGMDIPDFWITGGGFKYSLSEMEELNWREAEVK